jgi:hypothetical protein
VVLRKGKNFNFGKIFMRKNNPPLTVVPIGLDRDPPPQDLGEPGADLWRRIMSEYQIADSGGREMLAQACRAADRAASLAELIKQDGEIVHTRLGPKRHPALGAELANRALVVQILGN